MAFSDASRTAAFGVLITSAPSVRKAPSSCSIAGQSWDLEWPSEEPCRRGIFRHCYNPRISCPFIVSYSRSILRSVFKYTEYASLPGQHILGSLAIEDQSMSCTGVARLGSSHRSRPTKTNVSALSEMMSWRIESSSLSNTCKRQWGVQTRRVLDSLLECVPLWLSGDSPAASLGVLTTSPPSAPNASSLSCSPAITPGDISERYSQALLSWPIIPYVYSIQRPAKLSANVQIP